MKTTTKTHLLFVAVVLVCFGLLPRVQAVLPPPDGGYPGGNTAEGTKALFSLTTGGYNTAVGWYSLFTDSTGSFNTGVGAGTLLLNTASGNTAIGSRTLANNTTGGTLGNIQEVDFGPNVAVGWQALESNTLGSANTAMGYQALRSFTTGPVGVVSSSASARLSGFKLSPTRPALATADLGIAHCLTIPMANLTRP